MFTTYNVISDRWSDHTSTKDVVDGNWHFIALTRDESQIKIYIDEVLDITIECSSQKSFGIANNNEIAIGKCVGDGVFYTGLIDDIKIIKGKVIY